MPKDLQPLITALAEAQVDCGCISNSDMSGTLPTCPECNGDEVIPHPLMELLRVACDICEGEGGHGHYTEEPSPTYWTCPGYRPATPDEAEAVGLKLLEATAHSGNPELQDAIIGILTEEIWMTGNAASAQRTLEAILNAMAQAVGVEVPA